MCFKKNFLVNNHLNVGINMVNCLILNQTT